MQEGFCARSLLMGADIGCRSSPFCSSPTSAAAIALRIPKQGRVEVSLDMLVRRAEAIRGALVLRSVSTAGTVRG